MSYSNWTIQILFDSSIKVILVEQAKGTLKKYQKASEFLSCRARYIVSVVGKAEIDA